MTKSRILAVCTAALLAMAGITGCEYSEIDGIGTRTTDEEHPPQHDLASFGGCEPGDLGQWRFNADPADAGRWIEGAERVTGCEMLTINRWG